MSSLDTFTAQWKPTQPPHQENAMIHCKFIYYVFTYNITPFSARLTWYNFFLTCLFMLYCCCQDVPFCAECLLQSAGTILTVTTLRNMGMLAALISWTIVMVMVSSFCLLILMQLNSGYENQAKEAAFLVRIFHVFLWTCSKLQHQCYQEGWLKRSTSTSTSTSIKLAEICCFLLPENKSHHCQEVIV